MAIRFTESDARAMGRATKGVKGIALMEGDAVIGMVVADPDGALLTVCENGYGKRTPFGPNTQGPADDAAEEDSSLEIDIPEAAAESPAAESPAADSAEAPAPASAMRYRKQRRGGKGLRDIRTSERNGPVIGVAPVRDGDDIMLITTQGMVNRTHVSEIRVIGRNTQGVRVMNLNEGDKIASVAKVARENGQEEGEDVPPETPSAESGPVEPKSPPESE
jgi:DNA gyrase subunit A